MGLDVPTRIQYIDTSCKNTVRSIRARETNVTHSCNCNSVKSQITREENNCPLNVYWIPKKDENDRFNEVPNEHIFSIFFFF